MDHSIRMPVSRRGRRAQAGRILVEREAFLARATALTGGPTFPSLSLSLPYLQTRPPLRPPPARLGGRRARPSRAATFLLRFWIRRALPTAPCACRSEGGLQGTGCGGSFVIGRPSGIPLGQPRRRRQGRADALRNSLRTYSSTAGDGGGFVIYEPNADGGGAYARRRHRRNGRADGRRVLILQSSSGWAEQDPSSETMWTIK
jgi:hypothetical protein